MPAVFDKEAYYYNVFHKNRNYKKQAEEIRKMYPEAKKLLEVGCGTGLLSVELEKVGFDVLGIDPSKGMLKFYKGKNCRLTTLQKARFKKNQFDVVICPYDVLNYIPHKEYEQMLYEKLPMISSNFYIETWNKYLGVKLLTFKKAENCWRIRIGFRWFNTAHLWYFFGGKGFLVNYHKLYFHD